MIKGIGTVRGSVEDNVFCNYSLKAVEDGYKKLLEFDKSITRVKAVIVTNVNGMYEGAVFGYKKGARKPFVANAFGHYTEGVLLIMVKVHKYDYIIEDALEILNKHKLTII